MNRFPNLPPLEYGDRPAKPPWPIKWALLGTVISAIALLIALYFGARALLGNPRIVAASKLSTNDLFNMLKLIFAVVAGLGGVVALVVAYRKQKVLEEEIRLSARTQIHSELVAVNSAQDAIERRVTDLYGQAVEQLGHSAAAVRLGGLYALERLGQDHREHRQTVIDVVCAHLRMPFQVEPTNVGFDGSSEVVTPNNSAVEVQQEIQVRLTAQRLLARHLRRSETGDARTDSSVHWSGMRVDLVGAHLLDIDFSDCDFQAADFSDAHFSRGRARFNNSTFATDTLFSRATFEVEADFSGTLFADGASFTGSRFKAQVSYKRARFLGNSGFNRSCFEQDASFEETVFTNTTWLRSAEFQKNAEFKGAEFGVYTAFDNTAFRGKASFARALFLGTSQFRRVNFLGLAQFIKAHFVGEVTFKSAKFRISPRFTEVTFDSTAIFTQAKFERTPDFARASAIAPSSNHTLPPSWEIDPQVPEGERGLLVEQYRPGLYPN